MQYSVYRLWEPVGSVCFSADCLYYSFCATLDVSHSDFVPLYFYGESVRHRLGLFNRQTCRGRISVRSFGQPPEHGVFSVLKEPWMPADLAGNCPIKAENTLFYRDNDILHFLSKREEFPKEFLPFCCFVYPDDVCGVPVLRLELSENGTPIMPEVQPATLLAPM